MSSSFEHIDGEVVFLATLTALPGKGDEVSQWLHRCQDDVKANEPGALEYGFARDGDVFRGWERYADKAAAKKHLSNVTLKAMLASGTLDMEKTKIDFYKGNF